MAGKASGMSIEFRCDSCRAWNALSRTSCVKCGNELGRYHRLYRVEVRGPDRKKVRRSVGRGQGLEAARQLEYELKQQVRQTKSDGPSEITWGEVVRRYLDGLEAEKRRMKEARGLLQASLKYFGDCPISDITPTRAREWQIELRRNKAESTVNNYVAICRSAWTAIVDADNPFKYLKYYKPQNQVTRYLNPDERAQLLEVARDYSERWYQWIAVSLGTGLRQHNVLHLRRDQVDWKTGTAYVRVMQKGGLPYAAPLSSGVLALLRGIAENGTPYFWANPRTNRPYHFKDSTWHMLKERAGIDRAFRWHDLRHDFGTRLYASTGNIKLVKEALGHSLLVTTERYAHLLPERLQAAIDAVDPLKPRIAHSLAHPVKKPQ